MLEATELLASHNLPVKFLADENMSRPLTRVAIAHGHDVAWSPKGTSDTVVFARSKKEKIPILTFDTDFLDTAKFPLANTPGRIVLRVLPTIFSFQCDRFSVFLRQILPTLDITDRLIVITESEVYVYEE